MGWMGTQDLNHSNWEAANLNVIPDHLLDGFGFRLKYGITGELVLHQ